MKTVILFRAEGKTWKAFVKLDERTGQYESAQFDEIKNQVTIALDPGCNFFFKIKHNKNVWKLVEIIPCPNRRIGIYKPLVTVDN